MWMVPLMFSFISMGFWSVIPTPPNRSRGRPWTSVHRLSKLFSWFNYVTNKPLHKTRIYDLKPRIRVNQFCNNKRKYIQYISFCCYKRSSMFYQNRLENKYKNLLRSETSMASLIKFLSKTILCFFLIQNWQFSPASEGCWLKEGNAGCLNNYLWIEKENNASHIVQSRRWNS